MCDCMVVADSHFFVLFWLVLKPMCHFSITIFFLILVIISSADSSGTLCVVIVLVLSCDAHVLSVFIACTRYVAGTAGQDKVRHHALQNCKCLDYFFAHSVDNLK